MSDKSGLSYTEFLKIFQRQSEYSANKNKQIEQAEMEFPEESIEEAAIIESESEEEQEPTAAENHIAKLCRICGGRGQIDIFSNVCDKYLTVPRSRYAKMKDVQISTMISDISDEDVEKEDGLPEFVCIHCLGYLQHAYNIRLAIKTTAANFREIRKIAEEDSIQMEANSIAKPQLPITVNQQEINIQKDEIEEDKYWEENFEKKKAKVKITTKSSTIKEKPLISEIKCPSCFRKSYSVKSFNAHTKKCILAVFERFFSEFKALYANRFSRKITEIEYVTYSISLMYNYIEKIKKIAANNDFNIDAVIKQLPPDEILIIKEPQQQQPSTLANSYVQQQRAPPQHNFNRFTSPDYGYSSNQ